MSEVILWMDYEPLVTNNRSKSQGTFSSSVISLEDYTMRRTLRSSYICRLIFKGQTQEVDSVERMKNVPQGSIVRH